jgi:hypothetical protein
VLRPVLSHYTLFLAAVTAVMLVPTRVSAQLIDIRFVTIDMYGGPVWASQSELGVAFGGRLGFADLFNRALHMGVELDWWTAERAEADLEVRDALGGLAVWRDITSSAALRPFLGLAVALHSIDTSRTDGSGFEGGESLEARQLEGVRVGASGFAGLTLRLSRTGAIWLIVEYRYTIVSEISNQELRAGLRLLGSGP